MNFHREWREHLRALFRAEDAVGTMEPCEVKKECFRVAEKQIPGSSRAEGGGKPSPLHIRECFSRELPLREKRTLVEIPLAGERAADGDIDGRERLERVKI